MVNQLIAALPRRERERIVDGCEAVDLALGAVLCESGQAFRQAYFPLNGFVSMVAIVAGHPPLEMGLVGSEGIVGASLALGLNLAPLRGVVQAPGAALRMSAPQLRHELYSCPALARALNLYLYLWMSQLAQTAACNRFHQVNARLARWLLMTHDRAHADHFHLTHQYLADMLGVQRSAVTIAAGALQQRKLIRYTRGEIRVLAREGLEEASCECYATVKRDYRQLLG
jgi:CRP-like cAMP-binding protein